MLSSLRKLLDNWVARAFFGLLIVVFVFWGISNVLTFSGGAGAVATVGGEKVDAATVEAAYQNALNQAQQAGQTPDATARQQIAAQALATVLRQRTLALEARRLGVATPDAVIRQLVYAMPAFQSNGVFSQAVFDQVLQENNRSPDQFLANVKSDLTDRQVVLPVIGGASPPDALVGQIFSFIAEQRFAETVAVPFAAQPAPAPPAEAVLQRYWRNHPALFVAPEIRTIRLVLLSPAAMAPNEAVSDAEVDAAYARATAGQTATPLRSVEVITTREQAAAARLAAAWRNGAGWPAIQAMAKAAGANPVELDDAKQVEFPSTVLGNAVFAAMPDEVTGPLQGPFGVFVFKVTGIGSSGPAPAALRGQIRSQLQLQMAEAAVAQDVDNVEDALAGQTPLDKLPGNLGLIALSGTIDRDGDTAEGTPAPIPGGADVRAAVVKAAFAAALHAPAQLITGPDGSYFALTVDADTPAAALPYDQARDKVLAAWTRDAVARAAEVKAATLYEAANAGQSLDDAASAAGFAVTMTPPVTRDQTPNGVPDQLSQILFTLNPGQATMLQTATGFTVAVLNRIVRPSPTDDPSDYAGVRDAMTKEMRDDVAQSFVTGLENRDKITINQKLFAQVYQ